MEVLTTFSPRTHTHYAELLRNAPEGVTFRALPEGWGHPAAGGKAGTFGFWKARAAWQLAGGPNVEWFGRGLTQGRPVFSALSLLLDDVPWALDLDILSGLMGYRHQQMRSPRMRRFLGKRLADPRLKAITYWSRIARAGAEACLQDPRVDEKGVLLYPSVDLAALPPPRPHAEREGTHVLFVGRAFEMKGGHEAVAAATELLARHPKELRFTFITDLPAGYAPPSHEGLRFLPANLPRERVYREFFAEADVVLFPTLYEVFGLVALEAFAFGAPLVGLDTYALPEVVTEGVDGRLVKGYSARWMDRAGLPVPGSERWAALQARHRPEERARIVADMVAALDDLVRDAPLRRRMGLAGRRKLEEGAFSASAQRRALAEVVRRLGA